ncbi:MAG: hypothetical protein ACMXYD_02860 [Candidatus Woesearchaeota archaeon]
MKKTLLALTTIATLYATSCEQPQKTPPPSKQETPLYQAMPDSLQTLPDSLLVPPGFSKREDTYMNRE